MTMDESSLKEYLLPYADRSSSEKSAFDDVDVDLPVQQRPSFWRRALPWILHLGLIAAYTTFFFMSMDYVKNFNSVFGLLDCKLRLNDQFLTRKPFN